jgi:P27 family predicted phage terminase small subunit
MIAQPEHLSDGARRHWFDLLPHVLCVFGRPLTDDELAQFAEYCALVVELAAVDVAIQKQGRMLTTKRGTPKRNPLLNDQHRLRMQMLKLAHKLGMTPLGRAEIAERGD